MWVVVCFLCILFFGVRLSVLVVLCTCRVWPVVMFLCFLFLILDVCGHIRVINK